MCGGAAKLPEHQPVSFDHDSWLVIKTAAGKLEVKNYHPM